MRLLMRFMRPYRGLIAVTLFAVLIDNVGTLLVPTMLANMVNTGITMGDVDYIYATACTCLSRPAWPAAARCWAVIFRRARPPT